MYKQSAASAREKNSDKKKGMTKNSSAGNLLKAKGAAEEANEDFTYANQVVRNENFRVFPQR